jgi:hypothetical protein
MGTNLLMKKLRCGWTIASRISRALVFFFCASRLAAASDQIPAGGTFWIRLTDPVSSFQSVPGSRVRAILAESPRCDGVPIFPPGTVVEGVVKSVRSVGLGFRHETARLDLQFGRLISRSQTAVDFSARVSEVANARESVKNGIILGIHSTNTPQGRITSRLKHLPTWNPYSDWVLVAYRLAFPISPEPEIYFPAGTDMELQLSAPLPVADLTPSGSPHPDFTGSDAFVLDEMLASWPERTTTTKGQDADIVNLVFIGSREQVERAFQAAGWMSSDPATKGSVLRMFHAYLALNGYSRAPISKQLFQGQPSDSTWEKSLNSYGKRDHLRIWAERETWQGRPIWASASSRETGAVLSLSQRRFLHRVDSDLDAERDKVVRDLTLAGCVEAVHESPRAFVPQLSLNATGDELRTGGKVAVVSLKDCSGPILDPAPQATPMRPQPGNKFTRYIRMQVLGFRSDVWRGNIIYGGYDLGRMCITAMRRHKAATYKAKRVPAPSQGVQGTEKASSRSETCRSQTAED